MMAVLYRNKGAFLAFLGLVIFVVIGVVGPLVIPLDMTPSYEQRFEPPSLRHLLGTDYAGRDIAQQMVHGTPDILTIAFSAGFFATLLALLVGIYAGLVGGRTDAFLTGVVDIFLTVPNFPIMAIFAALFEIHNPVQFGLILSLWAWPPLARSIRARVLTLRSREFIEVCEIQAMGRGHVVFREILPNVMPFVTINFINIAKNAITASAGIMMLGLVPLRVENWGMMLNLAVFQSGAIFIPHAYSYVLSPMLGIMIFQYCLVRFAGGIDEIFDPRLRAW